MAFGGFFGGSSSSDDKDNSSSSSSSSSSMPTISNPLSSSFPPPNAPSSSSSLQRIQAQITQQTNVANATILLTNVNGHCFDKCVPSPNDSLSGSEQKCLSVCMEKYIDAWNVASKTYGARLQRESAAMGGQFGGLGGQAGGKEMF